MKKFKIDYSDLSEKNLKLYFTLSRISHALHKRLGKICNEGDLTISQFNVLDTLYHKGELTINEIIESVQSTSGNMTVVIHNLEKNFLVVRHMNPIDKRSCLISITDTGREQIEKIFCNHRKDLKINFEKITEEEKDVLMAIIHKMIV